MIVCPGRTVATSVCDYQHVGAESCFDKYWKWACIFGAFQIIPCFIPNLDSTKWTAWLGAAMSFGYSSIALGRSIAEGESWRGSLPVHWALKK